MEKNNMDEQMEKVSGGQITANVNVTLTGDDALAYLNSDLYKNSKNKNMNNQQQNNNRGARDAWGNPRH